jgi:lactoylglutathione lyase
VLGGVVGYAFPPEGQPAFVSLQLGSAEVGLARAADAPVERRQRFALWIYVDDCDALVERVRAAGAEIVEEPANQPWGERVARFLDPDANEIVAGQRLQRV